MNAILKIEEIRLPKLNNAEYTNFMVRTREEINIATVEKLGITAQDVATLDANIEKMQNLVAHSRVSDDTAKLAELDNERDNIVIYMMGEINNKLRSPLANVKAAATSLYNATKHYVGIQNDPDQQETQKINGLLLDLAKENNAANATTLGLDAVIAQLRQVNDQYAELTIHRTNATTEALLENSKLVRAENDPIYDYIITKAFAVSVITPSDEVTLFVKQMNALIAETETRYNQRKAAEKSKEPV